MTYEISAGSIFGRATHPMLRGTAAVALQVGQFFVRVMKRRKTRAALLALDDFMLKDIGVSRGEIERLSSLAADPDFTAARTKPRQSNTKLLIS